ncbi:hypothetical protein PILCRDRAFT_726129 [Piloderma croceum F 1598]|uniref:Uncharacterized protein n=1 Tax=Piloderma croceum (strain F 1598) TaxID=765440 RepID=A0A0C3EZY8_PILCF|nr:hypothetical protein PILCRDRAFT_726129 [Piloderma croceum F 1598]
MFKPKLSRLNISVTTSKPPAFANPHLLLHQSRIVGEVGIRGGDHHQQQYYDHPLITSRWWQRCLSSAPHGGRSADDRCNEEIKLRQRCRARETNIMHVVRRGQRNGKRR